MRVVNFLIFLFLILFMVFATILILAIPKEYGYQYYGFGIYISVWILILLYQKASFYPHNIKSLPKDRLYYIFEKNRVRGKHIFKLAELHGNGFTGKKWTLVHDENIETPCFRIDKKREFQPVS